MWSQVLATRFSYAAASCELSFSGKRPRIDEPVKCSSLNSVTAWPVALSQIHAIYEEVLYNTVPLRLSSQLLLLLLLLVLVESRNATSQKRHQAYVGLLLDVVIRQGPAILKLFAREDQPLLIRWDALLVLNLGFDTIYGVASLHIHCDGLASQGLHEDLNLKATSRTWPRGVLGMPTKSVLFTFRNFTDDRFSFWLLIEVSCWVPVPNRFSLMSGRKIQVVKTVEGNDDWTAFAWCSVGPGLFGEIPFQSDLFSHNTTTRS